MLDRAHGKSLTFTAASSQKTAAGPDPLETAGHHAACITNIYLHCVDDLWVQQSKRCVGVSQADQNAGVAQAARAGRDDRGVLCRRRSNIYFLLHNQLLSGAGTSRKRLRRKLSQTARLIQV
jgi:hypothetical protein